MKGLLFGSHALRQMLLGDDRVLLDWMAQQNRGQVVSTCTALARLLEAAATLEDVEQRRRWERKIETAPKKVEIKPFSFEAARKYSALRCALQSETRYDEFELVDLAIAADAGLAFVAPSQPWHDKVREPNVLDPWQTYPTFPESPTGTSSR